MDRRFRVLLVHGPYPLVRGYIAGYLAGRSLSGKVYYCEKEKIEVDLGEDEGLPEKLAEWIGFRRDQKTSLAVEEGIHGPVMEALKSAPPDLGISVEASRAVAVARFGVRFETYSTEEGAEIRELLENPPKGIVPLGDLRINEKHHKDAKGVEGYAPEHDYELKGKGTFAGSLDKVVEFRRRVLENPLVHCESIKLELE
ncbi:MAG: hypothetical protein ABIK65_12635 [Candidatus Eisenbacteria bacterium]